MRVLIVEDDRMIGEAMKAALIDAAYAVDWVHDGEAALTAAQAQRYDVILLDLGLPRQDGHETLRLLRQRGVDCPLLVITARDALQERLRGLDGGADDFLLKPFDTAELLARMRAVLRRKGGSASPVLFNGDMSLDPASHTASVDGSSVSLSAREFALLRAFMLRPGAILSRAELEERLYGWNAEVESNAIEFLIHALRKKLGSSVIRNVRGVGWMVSKRS